MNVTLFQFRWRYIVRTFSFILDQLFVNIYALHMFVFSVIVNISSPYLGIFFKTNDISHISNQIETGNVPKNKREKLDIASSLVTLKGNLTHKYFWYPNVKGDFEAVTSHVLNYFNFE